MEQSGEPTELISLFLANIGDDGNISVPRPSVFFALVNELYNAEPALAPASDLRGILSERL